jgi:acyl carrier protein
MTMSFVPPQTETELALAAIWAEQLKLEKVGLVDDLFDLGGDSLMMTNVIAKVSERFRVDLTIRALFEAPTIKSLAARIDTLRAAA